MWDAVVAGGGPAGAAAAIALARAGRRVLLCEAGDGAEPKVGEALPPAAATLLRDLGAAGRVAAGGHLRSYGNVAAWGTAEAHAVDFLFDPNGPGWHVDRPRFEAALRHAARDTGATVRCGAQARLIAGPAPWELTCGGDQIEARAFVDATGRRAVLARRLGARRERLDRLAAVWATLEAEAGGDARTFVEAHESGWWYASLVPGGRRVAAFLTDADLMAPALRTAAGFTAALAGTRLPAAGEPLLQGPRTAPAHGARLTAVAGPGWAAAGDAALACDPISSQGLVTALFTGLAAGRAVAAWLGGDDTALPAYAARVGALVAGYERNHRQTYALEARWADRPFWARRRSGAAAAA